MNAFAGMFASFAVPCAANAAAQGRLLPELAPGHRVAGGDVLGGDPGSPFTSPEPPRHIGVVHVFRGAGETIFAHSFE